MPYNTRRSREQRNKTRKDGNCECIASWRPPDVAPFGQFCTAHRSVYPPTAMTQPFPLDSLLSALLPFLPFTSPLLSWGSGGMTRGKFFRITVFFTDARRRVNAVPRQNALNANKAIFGKWRKRHFKDFFYDA